jgi:hypothetical protein
MTLKLEESDRFYKMIEARINDELCKKFVSKIDKDGNVTIYTYIFGREDIRPDGTVSNKRMGLLIGPIPDIQFYDVIYANKKWYPNFEIIRELDYSNMTQDEAIKKIMNDDTFVVTKEGE